MGEMRFKVGKVGWRKVLQLANALSRRWVGFWLRLLALVSDKLIQLKTTLIPAYYQDTRVNINTS